MLLISLILAYVYAPGTHSCTHSIFIYHICMLCIDALAGATWVRVNGRLWHNGSCENSTSCLTTSRCALEIGSVFVESTIIAPWMKLFSSRLFHSLLFQMMYPSVVSVGSVGRRLRKPCGSIPLVGMGAALITFNNQTHPHMYISLHAYHTHEHINHTDSCLH
jgi:hypothetical protein